MASASALDDPLDESAADTADLAEINMIPLIDVMLVLLAILLLTAPLLQHAVRVDLPRAASRPLDTKPEAIVVAVDPDGALSLDGATVTREALQARLRSVAAEKPETTLRLMADASVAYRAVAEVLADASGAGLARIAFVSTPGAQAAGAPTPAPAPEAPSGSGSGSSKK